MNKQSYTAMDYIENALDAIQERKSIHPSFSLYNMAEKQVAYVRDILTGKNKDKSKLHALNLGAMAEKEFETTDEELARHLSNVNYIASQMAQGLKGILPHEQDNEYLKRQKRYRN
ncbi:TPA: immunity protein Tsi6 family protein [Enterobacter cloacae]